MSDRSDLMWHRASLLGDIVACHRWLQVAGQPDPPPTCALLVADDGPETAAVRERLQPAGFQVTLTRPSELASLQTPHDVVIRLGAPSQDELKGLAPLVGRDGLLLITAPSGSVVVDLIDVLRDRFASVLELAQTRVTGSAITNTAQALGFPQIVSWSPGSGAPTPGAPDRKSVV